MEDQHRQWREEFKRRHTSKENEIKELTSLISQSYNQIKDPITNENLRTVAKISSEIVELTKKASGSPFRG